MGLSFVKYDTKIDFVGMRRIAYVLSVVVILIGFASIAMNGGLRYGIDFAGGAVVQVKFDKPVEDEAIKKSLASADLPGLSIQRFGEGDEDYLIRISDTGSSADSIRQAVSAALQQNLKDVSFSVQRLEMVGPKVGADLRSKAVEALYYAVLLIAVYISGRFEQRWMASAVMAATLWGGMYLLSAIGLGREWLVLVSLLVTVVLCWKLKLNFALGAIIALLHDVLISIGLLSLLGKEFDLNIIAALLTLIGYSLNDTIIVYDRIRETLRTNPDDSFDVIINRSINQTLSRTILTGGTTLMVIVSLFFLGGGVIHDFALTMFFGVFIGTLSSIFVASPVLLAFGKPVMAAADADYEKPGEHGIV